MSLLGREYLSVPVGEDPPGPGDARSELLARAVLPSPRRRVLTGAGRRRTGRDDLAVSCGGSDAR